MPEVSNEDHESQDRGEEDDEPCEGSGDADGLGNRGGRKRAWSREGDVREGNGKQGVHRPILTPGPGAADVAPLQEPVRREQHLARCADSGAMDVVGAACR